MLAHIPPSISSRRTLLRTVIGMEVATTGGNVETVKRMYESFAEGDIGSVVATWTPDIELREPEGMIGGGTHHGSDGITENVFGSLANDWEEVSVVPERFVDGGNTVVALLDFSGTYTETGKSIEYQGAHVFEFDDGKIRPMDVVRRHRPVQRGLRSVSSRHVLRERTARRNGAAILS